MDKTILLVVGLPRSGTTLLAEQLNQRLGLAIGPETGLLNQTRLERVLDEGEGVEERLMQEVPNLCYYRPELERIDLTRCENRFELLEELQNQRADRKEAPIPADKSPHDWPHMESAIQNMRRTTKVIYCFRDPRDVMRSHARAAWSAMTEGELVAHYRKCSSLATRLQRRHPDRVWLHHHEYFVKRPKETLTKLAAWLRLGPREGKPGQTFDPEEEPWKHGALRSPDPDTTYLWTQQRDQRDLRLSYALRNPIRYHGYPMPIPRVKLRQRLAIQATNWMDRIPNALRQRIYLPSRIR